MHADAQRVRPYPTQKANIRLGVVERHIRFAVDRNDTTGEYRTRNVVWCEALTSVQAAS